MKFCKIWQNKCEFKKGCDDEMVNEFLEEYQRFVKSIMRPDENKNMEICNWGLGLAGEAADAASCIKKTVFHKNDQTLGLKENLGDTLWYIGAICNFCGWTIEEVMKENMVKLDKRYKDCTFKVEHANRNNTMIDWNEK